MSCLRVGREYHRLNELVIIMLAIQSIIMEEVTDPVELEKAHRQREKFDRNSAWLQAHAGDVYRRFRGKCICIAGEELFVADTPEEVIAMATAAHPDDDGSFVRYIPREKLPRVYAN